MTIPAALTTKQDSRRITVSVLAYLVIMLSGITHAAEPLQAYLFASSSCHECMEVKQNLLPRLQASFADRVAFTHIKLDEIEGFELLLKYEQYCGVQNDAALKVFVGDAVLCGKTEIMAMLEATLTEQLTRGTTTPTPAQLTDASAEPPAALAEQRIKLYKPSAIALAGLLDGINPCAFTTLVFFVSLLTSLRKSRGQIIAVGLCFAAAVFVTYLALGLGALTVLKTLSVSTGLARLMTRAVALFALTLAGFSLADFLAYRRTGSAQALSLKLPHRVRVRMTRLISTQMRTRNLVVGALTLGVVVSVLESLCTGQVYLPTLMYVVNDQGLASGAVLWLLFYNLMFVLPLLGVFALVGFGLSSERLLALSKRHLGSVKLALAFLFVVLGGLLLATSM